MVKTKITTTLSAIILAMLFALTAIIFTGCGTYNLSYSEASKTAEKVATSYYADHIDYNTFANSTFKSTETTTIKESQKVEYINPETEAEVKETLTVETKVTHIKTLSIKKQGNDLIVRLVSDYKCVVIGKIFNEETLLPEVINEEYKFNIEYNYLIKTENEVTTYYLTRVDSSQENTEEPVVFKEYITTTNRDDYISAISNLLEIMDNNFVKTYFNIFSAEYGDFISVANLIKVTKAGDTTTLNLTLSGFDIDDYDYSIYSNNMTGSISFKGDKLGQVKTEMYSTGPLFSYTSTLVGEVIYSAEVPETIISDDFTEVDYLEIEDKDIPQIELAF